MAITSPIRGPSSEGRPEANNHCPAISPGRIRCLLPNPNSDTTIFFQPPENAYKALNLNLMHLPIPPLQNRASGFSEPFRLWFWQYLAAISRMAV